MGALIYLRDILLILAFAVVVVTAFHRFRLPTIAGLILAGLMVGPSGLSLVSNPHEVELLAEIGVALLLFGIGAELSLEKLRRLWKLAAVGGILQVGLTFLAGFGVCRMLGVPSASATFIGMIVALSSTAIVLRGLQQRGDIDAPHGRLILGILVFQDFSVIPMMLLLPLLTGGEWSFGEIVTTLGKSIGIIVAVLVLAIFAVPRVLHQVARTRQRQLFVLTVFVISLGTAWLVTMSGASLAIGAFLAGLVVSGSEYRHQALADMIAFRDVFASLFFVSIGMLLSLDAIAESLVPIVTILAGVLVGKAAIVFLASAAMRMSLRVCSIAALALAQVGEFSFILLYSARGSSLVSPALETSLVSVAILSMLVTPFALSFGPTLAAGLGRSRVFRSLLAVDTAEDRPDAAHGLQDHVVIAGYGFGGRELAMILDQNGIPYIVVDINIDNVRRASRETSMAVYGDVTNASVLERLNIAAARDLVLLINDPGASRHAISTARAASPDVHITVRTAYLQDRQGMLAGGANVVVSAEQEATVQAVSLILGRYQVDGAQISRAIAEIRDQPEIQDEA